LGFDTARRYHRSPAPGLEPHRLSSRIGATSRSIGEGLAALAT
jgi:hypothetical protein